MGDGSAASSAGLLYPAGVSVDSVNNVYIVDQKYHAIRKINAVSGKIITVAGRSGVILYFAFKKMDSYIFISYL